MTFRKHLNPLLGIIYKNCKNVSHLQTNSELNIEQKPDRTFVTNLDKELNKKLESSIIEYIQKEGINARIVAEESWRNVLQIKGSTSSSVSQNDNNYEELNLKNGLVFYVDPIDGTASFIEGRSDWCIMCGLCEHGIPVLGIVWAPKMNTIWYATKGDGAFKMNNDEFELWYNKYENDSQEQLPGVGIHVQNLSDYSEAVELRSSSRPLKEMDYLLDKLKITKRISLASMGIKCCLIAEGEAHVYVNACCSFWDSCGPRIILEEAGGIMCRLDRTSPIYEGFSVEHDYLQVSGIISLTHEVCDYLQQVHNNK